MPYKVTKRSGGKYRVMGPSGVRAKGTTAGKAKRQVKLLRAIEHGFKPTNKKTMKKKNPTQTKKKNPVLSIAGQKGSRKRTLMSIMRGRK